MTGWGMLGAGPVLTCSVRRGADQAAGGTRRGHRCHRRRRRRHRVRGRGAYFAQLLGGWFTQQSPAGISTGLVVAALTVIEPASAVGIGAAGLGRRSAVGLSVTPPAERDHLIRVSR